MCGIAGIISKSDRSQLAQKSKAIQSHRGPDASAVSTVQLSRYQVNFTHNRLSIIDLSTNANQPFWDESHNYGIIFNGEIYNYLELRQELQTEGVSFATQSDTEVLLKALIHWSPEVVLNKANGMWAFAFIDKKNERVLVSRDRYGKKPFYYYNTGDELYWSSEIKYILETAGRSFSPNESVVARYVQQFLLESDEVQTFFKDIWKVPPGSYCWLDLRESKIRLEPKKYYEIPRTEFKGSLQEATEELRFLVRDSVKLRLRSDVNVGFLLSGGLDSSYLVGTGHAIQQQQGSKNLKFLSVVSEDPRFDESPHIRAVESFLGIYSEKINIAHDHHQVFQLLSKAQWHNDEPLTSLSAVSYMMMMERARDLDAKVLLTGQGADEIFCGYKKYLGFYLKDLVRRGHPVKALATGFGFLKTGSLVNEVHLGELKRYMKFLEQKSAGILSPRLQALPQPSIGLGNDGVCGRQILDLMNFSVPALLHYEDRLSMAYSREVRAPFLDKRIANFGISLPMDYKINHGWSKYVLRQASVGSIPDSITWRKDKRGFTIPQESWFKKELRPEIEKIFRGDSLMYQFGLIDSESLIKKYELFCSDKATARMISFKEIFVPLALENWLQVFKKHLS